MKLLHIKSLRWIALGILLSFGSQLQVLIQAKLAFATEASENIITLPTATTLIAKTGTQIGPAIDCDGDGQQNDFRIDYDGDGIPDECLIGNQLDNSKPPETQAPSESETLQADPIASATRKISAEWEAMQKQLENCQVSRKTEKFTAYSVCIRDNSQVVMAAEAQAELGDGLGYWLRGDQIRAVEFFHTGEVWFFNNGRLEAILINGIPAEVKTTFSQPELDHAKRLVPDGHLKILQVFDMR